jgi:hypothetical protein
MLRSAAVTYKMTLNLNAYYSVTAARKCHAPVELWYDPARHGVQEDAPAGHTQAHSAVRRYTDVWV